MIKPKLSEISKSIKPELDKFNDIFKDSMKSKVGLVDLVANYILRQKSKKIRPLLVLLSAQICGGITERSYRGAVLVELLHTATLVHDDVVDNADKRRGFWSINALFKNKIAVLMGDYLLSRGLMLAVEGKDYDFLGVVTNAVKRMSEGELLQIQKTRKLDMDEVTYFKVISDKTASLLETCCQIGAMSASDNAEYYTAMREFGSSIGIAFQIRDDILDCISREEDLGKPVKKDLFMGRPSIVVLDALNSGISLESMMKCNNGELMHLVSDSIEYADRVAHEEFELAKSYLETLPETYAKRKLIELGEYIINRRN